MIYQKVICPVCGDKFAGKVCPQGCKEGDAPWPIKFGQKVWYIVPFAHFIQSGYCKHVGVHNVEINGTSLRINQVFTDLNHCKHIANEMIQENFKSLAKSINQLVETMENNKTIREEDD